MRSRLLCLMAFAVAAIAPPRAISFTAADGRFTCEKCHQEQMERPSRMATASARAEDSTILRTRGFLDRQLGSFHQQVAIDHGRAIYTVSNGTVSLRTELAWAIGSGTMGQAFLYREDGRWFETQVTYYGAIHGLDLQLGGTSATDMASAVGRQLSDHEVRGCFRCHATASGDPLAANSDLIPGVKCLACHAPAAVHIQNAKIGKFVLPPPPPASLSAGAASQLCGKCHRTWENVISNGPHGRDNVRFQPYRLANSKCYNPNDPRISCVACHDPHHPVETSIAAYDSKCLACHAQRSSQRHRGMMPACRVARSSCASCHMPRYKLPQTQESFADHWIRIVRPNEPYPD